MFIEVRRLKAKAKTNTARPENLSGEGVTTLKTGEQKRRGWVSKNWEIK